MWRAEFPDRVRIRLDVEPRAYEFERLLTLGFAPPVRSDPGTLVRDTPWGLEWTYTPFDEPSVYSCFGKAEDVGVAVQVDGSACGAPRAIHVYPVFKYAADVAADYAKAYEWVTRIRHPWLRGFVWRGQRTGFSGITFSTSPSVSCGGREVPACTNCLTDHVTFGTGAFLTEWRLASTILHELIHTTQPCFVNCAECETYCAEVAFAAQTGIGTCDREALWEALRFRAQYCTFGCSCQ